MDDGSSDVEYLAEAFEAPAEPDIDYGMSAFLRFKEQSFHSCCCTAAAAAAGETIL